MSDYHETVREGQDRSFERAQKAHEAQEPPDDSCPFEDDCKIEDCEKCDKTDSEFEDEAEDLGYDPDVAYEDEQDRINEGK